MSEELHLDELEMVSRIGMATHPRVVGQLVDRLRAAEAEVARLTAVVQGVREIATAIFEAAHQQMLDTGDSRPLLDFGHRLFVLAGGTDTPKATDPDVTCGICGSADHDGYEALCQPEPCGGRWNCTLPKGHNMGQVDIPENHAPAAPKDADLAGGEKP